MLSLSIFKLLTKDALERKRIVPRKTSFLPRHNGHLFLSIPDRSLMQSKPSLFFHVCSMTTVYDFQFALYVPPNVHTLDPDAFAPLDS